MIERREFIQKAVATGISGFVPPFVSDGGFIFRIIFGACANQNVPQPIWKIIASKSPDLYIALGDNLYADTLNRIAFLHEYRKLEKHPDFKKFRETTRIIGIADDHDTAYDDCGAEVPAGFKEFSKLCLMNFLREPMDSERRIRPGTYTSYMVGEHPNKLQIILLDLRSWRGMLLKDEAGAYIPTDKETLLGKAQWKWLEKELSKEADFRLIGSSIQMLANGHPWEKWGNFPHELERFVGLVDYYNCDNLLVLSGDMHRAELSRITTKTGITLNDFTSSGLTHFEKTAHQHVNSNRVHVADGFINFGLVDILWQKRVVEMKAFDGDGNILFQEEMKI